MKKTPLLNIALSRLIASLGHGDMVVIGDAGLPVPPGVELIDLALPYAQKSSFEMHYRQWDRTPPTLRDECGIPSADGAPVVPDVVLVPCLGYTASGYRLGYGGGYYDRWLAAHPHVTAVGIAWSATEIAEAELVPQPHDHPLMVVVTDAGVVG